MHLLVEGEGEKGTVIFAHGAGAAMDHPMMGRFNQCFLSCGLKVVRFEFPYMSERRINGKKRPPNQMPVLEQCYLEVVERFSDKQSSLYLAGKSMGGRVATHILQDTVARGAIVFGYPFHPINKPETLRTAHLAEIAKPLLVFQGTRDKLGNREEVPSYALSDSVEIEWMEDGDHDLKPRVRSGFTLEQHLSLVIQRINSFIEV